MSEDPRSIKALLDAARKSATLELFNCGHILPDKNDLPYPSNEKEVTDFVKNRISLHHRTWIIGPIEEAMKKLGYEIDD